MALQSSTSRHDALLRPSPILPAVSSYSTAMMAQGSGVPQPPAGTLSPPDSSSSASQSPISPTNGGRIPQAVADVPAAGLSTTSRSPEDPASRPADGMVKDDSDGRSRESAVPAACLACVSFIVQLFALRLFPSPTSPTSLGARLVNATRQQQQTHDSHLAWGYVMEKTEKWRKKRGKTWIGCSNHRIDAVTAPRP